MTRIAGLAVVTLVVLIVAAPALAQPGDDGDGAVMRVFDHFLRKGGAITWFVLVPLSVATVALTIEYCLSIRRQTFVPPETYRTISSHLHKRAYAEAIEYAASEQSVLAGVVNTALLESRNGYAAMERAVEETLEENSARMMRKIEYLNVIGNISPMVGLFGTVYGMIGLFASIRVAGGMPEPARIADDISIALVTTFWGLLVAIPALSVFALFRNRIDVLTAECALAVDRLFSSFKPGAAPMPRPGPSAEPAAVQSA